MNFFLHSVLHALEHSATASKHDVLEEVLLDVGIALHDRVKCVVVDSLSIRNVVVLWIEEQFRTLESFFLYIDLDTAWQRVELILV